jgi:acyl-CoA synthetase (NDP forming)
MSAARAVARIKPVVVIKAGRHAQAAKAAATRTGALAGSDTVYDAAFRRAGLLRVRDLGELFDAAETLGRLSGVEGKRLAILTNGGGIGVLEIDRLMDFGGVAAELSPATNARLDTVLPQTGRGPIPSISLATQTPLAMPLLFLICLNLKPALANLNLMSIFADDALHEANDVAMQ